MLGLWLIFLKKSLILFERQGSREREGEQKSSIAWTSQIPTRPKAESGCSQKPGTVSGLPMRSCRGPRTQAICCFPSAVVGAWIGSKSNQGLGQSPSLEDGSHCKRVLQRTPVLLFLQLSTGEFAPTPGGLGIVWRQFWLSQFVGCGDI